MKVMIETDISDKQFNELKNMGYDVNYPFSVNITLDYGDKVIYCDGKIKSEVTK